MGTQFPPSPGARAGGLLGSGQGHGAAKTKTSFPDTVSRMGQLRADMHNILDEHNAEGVLVAHEQKKLMKYMVAALEPPEFRDAIRKRLEYAQHKPLKSDIVKCYAWILEQLKAYIVWQPHTAEAQNKPSNKGSPSTRREQHGCGHGNKPEPSQDSRIAARGAQAKSHSTPAARSSRRLCRKSGPAAHLVRQCPGIQQGKAESLLAVHKAANAGSKPQVKRTTVAATSTPAANRGVGIRQLRCPLLLPNTSHTDDGTALATIEG